MFHDRQCLSGGVSQSLGSGPLNEYGLERLVARCSYCQVGISATVPIVRRWGFTSRGVLSVLRTSSGSNR